MTLHYNEVCAFDFFVVADHLYFDIYKSPVFTILGKYLKICPSSALTSKLPFAPQINCLCNFYNTNESAKTPQFAKYEFQWIKNYFNEKKIEESKAYEIFTIS